MSKIKAALIGVMGLGALALAPAEASAQVHRFGGHGGWSGAHGGWNGGHGYWRGGYGGWDRGWRGDNFWPAAVTLGAIGGLVSAATWGGGYYDDAYDAYPAYGYPAYGYPAYAAPVAYDYAEPIYAAPRRVVVRERVVVRRPAIVRSERIVVRQRPVVRRSVTNVRYVRPSVQRTVIRKY